VNKIKFKWHKVIALTVLLPLAGCAVDLDDEEVEALVKTELGIEDQTDNESTLNIAKNAIALLPDYVAVEVHWQDLADNENGFLIERSNSETGEFKLLTSLASDETSYIDIQAKEGSTYCYRVGAYNDVGVAYSDVSCKSS